jgi:hypothetical protein
VEGDPPQGAKLLTSLLGPQTVNIPNDVHRNAGLPNLVWTRSVTFLGSNRGQFTGIEPVTGATGALVHFDPAFGAKEVPVESHARAAGTFTLAGLVHDDALVALDVQQKLTRSLALLIHAPQFEGIKPNPPATTLADIYGQVVDLEGGQVIETGWAFHILAFP